MNAEHQHRFKKEKVEMKDVSSSTWGRAGLADQNMRQTWTKTNQTLFPRYHFKVETKSSLSPVGMKTVCGPDLNPHRLSAPAAGEVMQAWEKAQSENACGWLNTLQNIAISVGHSQRASGLARLHTPNRKTTPPADNICTSVCKSEHTNCRADPPESTVNGMFCAFDSA